MSNYGAIPASRTSSPVYRGPSAPPASRTSVQSQSQSRSHSQSSSFEDVAAAERNANGSDGLRNVRFASPQGRGRSERPKLEDDDEDDGDQSVADSNCPEPSSGYNTISQQRTNGVENGDRSAAQGRKDMMNALRGHLQPSLVLENAGSVARDHLASERTFLAYVRTSLAIASSGVALVQLFSISTTSSSGTKLNSQLQKFARPLGAVVVCTGIFLLIVGSTRYFRVQKALIAGKFPVARKTVVFVSSVLVILVAVLFGVLVAVPRR